MPRVGITASLVFSFAAAAAQGAISIPGSIKLPTPPNEMLVYPLNADSGIAARASGSLTIQVLKFDGRPSGESSRFLSVDGPGNLATPAIDREAAAKFFAAALPVEPTTITRRVGRRAVVARQSVPAGGPPGEIVEEWALVRADRFVNGLPVYGPGSVAVAELRGGAVSGHMIRWDRAGEPTSRPTRALSRLLLSQELARNFDEGSEDIRAVGTELVYFDDRTRLYPAYRTSVEVDHHDSAPPDRVDLFIPAVKPDALVNVDAATSGPHCEEVAPVKGSGLVVDRYVINDEPEWASNADLFHRQLAADTDFGARNFCLLEPRMLKAEQASYIDSATVALLETHGIPRHVKTFRYNKGEYWQDLADVGGLGDADPALRLLILHSCSVVCTTDEDADWFKVWFQVFQGLHTVLGYHTKVSYRDGVSAAFASHLRDDEPMIRGWMAEIVASSTYQDTTHYGLGAAVTVCGQGDARPSQLARMSSPACLAAYWLRD